jgi:hypothetical protein
MFENTKNVSTDAKAAPSKEFLGGPQDVAVTSKEWLGGPQNGAVTSNADAYQDLRAAMEKIILICEPLLQSGNYQGTELLVLREIFGYARQLSGQNG